MIVQFNIHVNYAHTIFYVYSNGFIFKFKQIDLLQIENINKFFLFELFKFTIQY